MKVKIRRYGKSMTISFSAAANQEGVDLKDALLASAGGGFSPGRVIDELRKLGYTGDITRATDTTVVAVLTGKPGKGVLDAKP